MQRASAPSVSAFLGMRSGILPQNSVATPLAGYRPAESQRQGPTNLRVQMLR